MGCASSKRIEAAVDVYRPPPSSFSVFDITSIQEPWLSSSATADDDEQPEFEKPAANNIIVSNPLLDKLQKFESPDVAPRSWDEVSKDLEDLKPAIKPAAAVNPPSKNPPAPNTAATPVATKKPRRSFSFHTLEELDHKISTPKPSMRKSESARTVDFMKIGNRTESAAESRTTPSSTAVVIKPVRENIFILRDKMEREKEGQSATIDRIKRDPLSDFPELCPPGGADSVVIYTTSLRGVRKTFDDCQRVANLMELQRVATDERDVSLHGGFLNELKELVGESAAAAGGGLTLPRVFIKGRYVGGVEEVEALNESGRLGRILSWARVERGSGRHACEGCGGARFVPCLDCGGSCKVVVAGGVNKERCGKCNENGLVHCPACA